jgi:hypothetical protein
MAATAAVLELRVLDVDVRSAGAAGRVRERPSTPTGPQGLTGLHWVWMRACGPQQEHVVRDLVCL